MFNRFGIGFSKGPLGMFPLCVLAGILSLSPAYVFAQEDVKAFTVNLTPDDLYTFDTITYQGNHLQFAISNGQALLGTIDNGVTVVMLFGTGDFKITTRPEFQGKAAQGFGSYPVTGKFTRAYIRLRPDDYAAWTKDTKITPLKDEKLFAQAREIYNEKFFGSYHAGEKATLPPEHSVFVDFETEAYGQVMVEEGFWLKLIRRQPYCSVYSRYFENPNYSRP